MLSKGKMIILSILAGYFVLIYELLYQKVFFNVSGDNYQVYLAIILTFIIGISSFNLFSFKFRKYLPYFEIFNGIYALVWYLILYYSDYSLYIPSFILPLVLLPLVAGLGLSLPLYSYYLKQIKLKNFFALYHLGGFVSILLTEFVFLNYFSLHGILGLIGVCHIGLGGYVLYLVNKKEFEVKIANINLKSFILNNKNLFPILLAIFFFACSSFVYHLWISKAFFVYSFMPVRIAFSLFLGFSFFWIGIGSYLANKDFFDNLYSYVGFVFSISLILLASQFYYVNIDSFLKLIIMVGVATLPQVFFNIFFIQQVDKVAKKETRDIILGIFLFIASLGNLLSLFIINPLGNDFWNNNYIFIMILIILSLSLICLKQINRKIVFVYTGVSLLALGIFVKFDISKYLINYFKSNYSPNIEFKIKGGLSIYGSPFDVEIVDKENGYNKKLMVIDGVLSHEVSSGFEQKVGLYPYNWFNKTIDNALIIGAGSGQTLAGIVTYSKSIDAVDISKNVINHLIWYDDYNDKVRLNKKVKFYIDDGYNYVRKVNKRYDLIFNTSTQMYSFSATKLYSTQMLKFVKQILTPNGIYVSYFDGSSLSKLQDIKEYVSYIQKHFKAVYLIPVKQRYYLILASNKDYGDIKIKDGLVFKLNKNITNLIFEKNEKYSLAYNYLNKKCVNTFMNNRKGDYLEKVESYISFALSLFYNSFNKKMSWKDVKIDKGLTVVFENEDGLANRLMALEDFKTYVKPKMSENFIVLDYGQADIVSIFLQKIFNRIDEDINFKTNLYQNLPEKNISLVNFMNESNFIMSLPISLCENNEKLLCSPFLGDRKNKIVYESYLPRESFLYFFN